VSRFKRLKKWLTIENNSGNENPQDKRGRRSALTLEEQVLVALEYWREYRTYFPMGTNWGVSESTICRIVTNIESTLMKTGKFGIPGKKALFKGFGRQQSCGNGCHRNSYRTPRKNRKNTIHSRKNTTA
jgi:hypothetical protein